MSSLLRLPSLDRPTLGLTKRFSTLTTYTASSTQDDLASSMASLRTLPSVEQFDNDDFLNMFEGSYAGVVRQERVAFEPQIILNELSATPSRHRFSELHGTPIQRFELDPAPTPRQRRPVQAMIRSESEQSEIAYRSSVSSSNPSTQRSNASSRRSRKSSMSSTTDLSSSERSAREFDKEKALHERLKRRSRDKRVSFGNTQPALDQPRLRSISDTHLVGTRSRLQAELLGAPDIPTNTSFTPYRPSSRGKRLGKAMADGLPGSPPSTPRSAEFQAVEASILSSAQLSTPRDRNQRRKSTSLNIAASSCVMSHPSVDGVDRIRVGIMSRLDNVDDLRSLSQVSKDFYQTFHKYETLLVDSVLYHQSPAAWHLRHSVRHLERPSPFRMRSVQRDLSTVHALEDFIVWRCQSILRPQTLDALAGEAPERKAELEHAIWMIWTFCNVFGKTSMSDATLLKQTQWLNGSGKPQNCAMHKGMASHAIFTTKQLEDMSEIWRCLEMLLSGFKGREEEARLTGLFDNVGDAKTSDRELLRLWIYDVLSLGPKAVLTLSSCDFEQAKVLGITRWTPPSKARSRSNFFKAAVEEVYRERLMKEARQKALNYRKNVQHNHSHKRSHSDPTAVEINAAPTPSVSQNVTQSLRLEIQNAPRHTMPPQGLPSFEDHLDIRPDCDPLSPLSTNHTPILSSSTNPGVFSPLVMTKNASTKMGATLFPMQNRDQSHRLSIPLNAVLQEEAEPDRRSLADVIDPTDKAVALMVQEMGFSEAEAKRALALSDTGAGINIERAIELLSVESAVPDQPRLSPICELPAAVGDARLAHKQTKQDLCEGRCKPMLVVEPKRDRVSGLGIVKRGLGSRMSFRKSNWLSVIPDEEEASHWSSNSTTKSNTLINRASTLSSLASSAVLTLSTPVLFNSSSSATIDHYEQTVATAGPSPVSPIVPSRDWLQPDSNPILQAQAYIANIDNNPFIPKPRITLQRVGTGMKKQSWTIPGRKKKAQAPEIIGYAY